MIGVTLFLAASAACGLAGSVSALVAARVLQAIGAVLLTRASLSIVLAAFPQAKRSVAVSLWGAVGGLAAAVGPSLGSLVVDSVGWPWAFYINLPLGALALRAARRYSTSGAPGRAPAHRRRRHAAADRRRRRHRAGHRRSARRPGIAASCGSSPPPPSSPALASSCRRTTRRRRCGSGAFPPPQLRLRQPRQAGLRNRFSISSVLLFFSRPFGTTACRAPGWPSRRGRCW